MAFQKPEKVKEGIKIFAYGESGSGKTPFVLSFPQLALADSDGSSIFYKDDCPNIVVMSNAVSINEVAEEFDDLESDEDLFDSVLSIGVDSMSRYYENLQHAALKVVEKRAKKNGRAIESEGLSVKEWGVIKLHNDRFQSKLLYYSKLGKNIIMVSESKDEKEAIKQADGSVTYIKSGITYNSSKGAEFDFDVVLEFYKDGKGGSLAKVIKDRTRTFPVDTVVEMANYSHWKEAIEKAQLGRTRDKSEIKTIDDSIKKDVENFNVDEDEKKMIKIVNEIKKIAKEKSKAGVPNEDINDIVGKMKYETLDEAKRVLEILNKR